MKSLIAVSVVFSLVLAISQCAPGRFGTVDQYRPAFDSEDGDDHTGADEHDSYYGPDYWTDSDEAVEVLAVSEVPQAHTRVPGEDHVTTSDDRHASECQTTKEPGEGAFTTTNEPTTDAQTTVQAVQ